MVPFPIHRLISFDFSSFKIICSSVHFLYTLWCRYGEVEKYLASQDEKLSGLLLTGFDNFWVFLSIHCVCIPIISFHQLCPWEAPSPPLSPPPHFGNKEAASTPFLDFFALYDCASTENMVRGWPLGKNFCLIPILCQCAERLASKRYVKVFDIYFMTWPGYWTLGPLPILCRLTSPWCKLWCRNWMHRSWQIKKWKFWILCCLDILFEFYAFIRKESSQIYLTNSRLYLCIYLPTNLASYLTFSRHIWPSL